MLTEIRARFGYLVQVGLGYLTLDRQSRTLSGGEVQRINLTTALGTSLVNTLFVLDEPSIGLHARDMGKVTQVLHRLRDAGNTLLVVEHDPQVMLAADRILDIGPGPGARGGEIVFFGTPEELKQSKRSLTAQYLNGAKSVVAHPQPKPPADTCIEILGAAENNLKNVDVEIPLQRLVCITGVSGSGKSTLVQDVLYNALAKLKGRPKDAPGSHRAIRGHELIDDVLLVDQSPIGKTTRSNPASYVGALDGIRKLFAGEPLARERRYTSSMFSFNAGNGRCPTCTGAGFEHVEMQFLSDVYIRCPDCDGKRFRAEILEVKLVLNSSGAKSIADVLDMTVSEAAAFFANYPGILHGIEPLVAVGLSYLKLGQPVPTLSGGEAQRLKLAGHLAEAKTRKDNNRGTLFLFDEPTTGLHFDDIATLLKAFQRLLDEGNTLVVIEHNLDVIRAADWIIDLGPEGGDAGGEIVCTGTPQDVAQASDESYGESAPRVRRARKSTRRRACRRAFARGRQHHPRPACARAQSEKHRSTHPARALYRHHRRLGQRQEHLGVRHSFQRRPAPLSRIAQRLCALAGATGVAAGCGCDLRATADGGHRTAHLARRTQEHGRDPHRDLPLPAPAVREARHAILSGV